MSNYLVHYGIPGQKWGNRRFQNEDGSLTPAGERRYYTGDTGSASRAYVSPEYQQEVAYNSQGNVYPNQGTSGTSSNRPHSRIKTVGNGSVTGTAGKTGYSDTENPVSGNAKNQYIGTHDANNDSQTGSVKPSTPKPHVSPEYQQEVAYNSQGNVYFGQGNSVKPTQSSGYRVQSVEESKKREQARKAYESRIQATEGKTNQPDSTTGDSLSSKIKSSVAVVKDRVANLLSKIGKLKF